MITVDTRGKKLAERPHGQPVAKAAQLLVLIQGGTNGSKRSPALWPYGDALYQSRYNVRLDHRRTRTNTSAARLS